MEGDMEAWIREGSTEVSLLRMPLSRVGSRSMRTSLQHGFQAIEDYEGTHLTESSVRLHQPFLLWKSITRRASEPVSLRLQRKSGGTIPILIEATLDCVGDRDAEPTQYEAG